MAIFRDHFDDCSFDSGGVGLGDHLVVSRPRIVKNVASAGSRNRFKMKLIRKCILSMGYPFLQSVFFSLLLLFQIELVTQFCSIPMWLSVLKNLSQGKML